MQSTMVAVIMINNRLIIEIARLQLSFLILIIVLSCYLSRGSEIKFSPYHLTDVIMVRHSSTLTICYSIGILIFYFNTRLYISGQRSSGQNLSQFFPHRGINHTNQESQTLTDSTKPPHPSSRPIRHLPLPMRASHRPLPLIDEIRPELLHPPHGGARDPVRERQ